MGGRGSSGAISAGKAENASMPTLTGSEKQVSWAEQIRSGVLKNVDLLVDRASDTSASPLHGIGLPQGGYVRPEAAKEVKEYVISSLQKITKASQLIDIRERLNYQTLEKSMILAQIEINKKKKR